MRVNAATLRRQGHNSCKLALSRIRRCCQRVCAREMGRPCAWSSSRSAASCPHLRLWRRSTGASRAQQRVMSCTSDSSCSRCASGGSTGGPFTCCADSQGLTTLPGTGPLSRASVHAEVGVRMIIISRKQCTFDASAVAAPKPLYDNAFTRRAASRGSAAMIPWTCSPRIRGACAVPSGRCLKPRRTTCVCSAMVARSLTGAVLDAHTHTGTIQRRFVLSILS